MVTGQKAEGKEETAQEQNREVEKRMGVGREKDMGAGKGAGTIKQGGLHIKGLIFIWTIMQHILSSRFGNMSVHGQGISGPIAGDLSLPS
jgi:hypothetical protein